MNPPSSSAFLRLPMTSRSNQTRLFPQNPGRGLGPKIGYRRPPPFMRPLEDDWAAWLAQEPAHPEPPWTTQGQCRCGAPANLEFDQELPESCVACAEEKV